MVDVSGDRDTGRSAVAGQRSLGQLFGEVSRELGALVEQEVELAKAQIREESSASARLDLRQAAMVVTGGMCLLFVSLALAWGLAEIMPTGFAFLVVAVLYAVTTGVLVMQQRRAAVEEAEADIDDADTRAEARADAGLDGEGINGFDPTGRSDRSPDRRIEVAQGRVELR